MSQIRVNSFTSYDLTSAEEQAGSILNHNQKLVLQNKLAFLAETKIRLKFDPSHVQEFLQQEAELQGQIGILTWLLETSAQIENQLVSEVQPQ